MTIFRKYFLTEFLKYFVIFILSFSAIATIAEFFDKADEFYSHQPSLYLIAKYLLLQTPRVMLYALPFASLFSILITIGLASKWRETIIIKASGSSTKKLFSYFLFMGVFISLMALVLGETVVPLATRTATYIRKVEILKQTPKIIQGKESLWLRGVDESLIRIKGFVEDKDRILRTSIFTFNETFGLKKRIEAEEAEWTDGRWVLKNVVIFDFEANKTEKYASYETTSLEEPRIFREEIKKPKEMNFIELYRYYSRLEKAGFKNLKYSVRLYEKLAYPTINFVMILFGIALALNTNWGGGIRAAGLGVVISVLYWFLYSTSISFGNTGILEPWLAPWISPIAFCIIGALFYSRIKE
jgi:lipopolysaccharide export system permease protein